MRVDRDLAVVDQTFAQRHPLRLSGELSNTDNATCDDDQMQHLREHDNLCGKRRLIETKIQNVRAQRDLVREDRDDRTARSMMTQPLLDYLVSLSSFYEGELSPRDVDNYLNVFPHMKRRLIRNAGWGATYIANQFKFAAKTNNQLEKDGLTRDELDHFIEGNKFAYLSLISREELRLRERKAISLRAARAEAPSEARDKLILSLNAIDDHTINQTAIYNVWKRYPQFNDKKSYDAYRAAIDLVQNLDEDDRNFDLEFEEDKSRTLLSHLTVLPPKELWERFDKIETFDISGTNVVNLSPISGLIGLDFLDCSNTLVFDMSPIQSLTRLQRLKVYETLVSSLSFVTVLRNLEGIDLSHTNISSISDLRGLTALEDIDLSHTLVTDISLLNEFEDLPMYNISGLKWLDTPIPGENPQAAQQRIQRNLATIEALRERDINLTEDTEEDTEE